MTRTGVKKKLISVVVPVFNEEKSLFLFYKELTNYWKKLEDQYKLELLFVNDGSADGSGSVIEKLAKMDRQVKYLQFTRNFGKEIAVSAGLQAAAGEAIVVIDADLQHPPHLIRRFLLCWEKGAEMVVGVRKKSKGENLVRKLGSAIFYGVVNLVGETDMAPASTDFRLMDRKVVNEFNRFTERNRIARGLIDWLGFRTEYVNFTANERAAGKSNYGFQRLIRLAINTFVSHSLLPLKVAGYLGIFITFSGGLLGGFILVESYLLPDPLGLNFSGTAMLAAFILFFIGVVLICLGLIALYIGNIHAEVINRPLFVVREAKVTGRRNF